MTSPVAVKNKTNELDYKLTQWDTLRHIFHTKFNLLLPDLTGMLNEFKSILPNSCLVTLTKINECGYQLLNKQIEHPDTTSGLNIAEQTLKINPKFLTIHSIERELLSYNAKLNKATKTFSLMCELGFFASILVDEQEQTLTIEVIDKNDRSHDIAIITLNDDMIKKHLVTSPNKLSKNELITYKLSSLSLTDFHSAVLTDTCLLKELQQSLKQVVIISSLNNMCHASIKERTLWANKLKQHLNKKADLTIFFDDPDNDFLQKKSSDFLLTHTIKKNAPNLEALLSNKLNNIPNLSYVSAVIEVLFNKKQTKLSTPNWVKQLNVYLQQNGYERLPYEIAQQIYEDPELKTPEKVDLFISCIAKKNIFSLNEIKPEREKKSTIKQSQALNTTIKEDEPSIDFNNIAVPTRPIGR